MAKFDVSSFSVTGYIYILKLAILLTFIDLDNCGQVKIDSIRFFLLTQDRSQLFYWVCARHTTKNKPKNSRTTHRIWHKLFSIIQSMHRIWRKLFSMIQLGGIKSWFRQSIDKLQRFSLLFLSVTRFSDFCCKIKYLW